MRFLLLSLLLSLTTSSVVVNAGQNYQKILLTDVQSLILKKNMLTSARRTEPVPQLKCISGCAHAREIETVFCKNVGSNGMDVNWECTAKPQLPAGVKLGDLEVVCEGYKNSEDPYILVGSCGLEYTLIGEPEYGYSQSYSSNQYSSRPYRSSHSSSSDHGWSWFSWLIFGLIIYFIYRSCTSRNSGGYGGGGGGGGGVNGPPPPPPYSQAQNQPPYGNSPGGPSYSGFAANQGQPGFWSGMGAGGIMGYMLGSRPNYGYGYGYNNYMHPPASSFFNSGYGSGYGSGFGGSSFGSSHSSSSSSSSHSSPADSTSYATSRRR